MNLFRSSPLCQVTQGEEFVRPPTEGVGGESERLAVLNLTETLIYLGAISLEINFLTASNKERFSPGDAIGERDVQGFFQNTDEHPPDSPFSRRGHPFGKGGVYFYFYFSMNRTQVYSNCPATHQPAYLFRRPGIDSV